MERVGFRGFLQSVELALDLRDANQLNVLLGLQPLQPFGVPFEVGAKFVVHRLKVGNFRAPVVMTAVHAAPALLR
jgi:hypothetical protein